MQFNLKLTQKALILIAAPILIGLVFFQTLLVVSNQVEKEAIEAEHADLVYTVGGKLTNHLISAGESLVKYAFSKQANFLSDYREKAGELPKVIHELQESLRKYPQDLARANKLIKTAELAFVYMEETRRLTELGDDAEAREKLKNAEPLILEAVTGITKLVKPYAEIEKSAQDAEKLARNRATLVVQAGLTLNVLLFLAITIWFNQGIARRLAALMDNIGRFKSGSELNPPIPGRDEIATLDHTFHDMAAIITQATEQLKASEARIRAVIEGLPVGVIVARQNGEIDFVNPRAESVFGYEESAFPRCQLTEVICCNDVGAKADFKESIINRALNRIEEFDGLRSDGTKVPIELTANEFSSPKGKGYLIGVQDITARRELERMKQEFVAMVSHDLRAPLSAMKLTLEILLMGKYGQLNEDGLQRVKGNQSNIDRLMALVNDLLDIEKLESGQMQLDLQVSDIQEIFERSVQAVFGLAHSRRITITAAPEHFDVVADDDRIVQVLVNLLSNSIKFSPESSTIEVSAQPVEQFLEIRVTDNGRGIPKDKISLVFERFKQVSSDDAKKLGGSGLGLSICKSIVEAHKGTIGVESEEGMGTTFWFRLPRPMPGLVEEW